MDVRYSADPAVARGHGTAQLRRHHLVEDVFVPGERGAVNVDGIVHQLERGDLVHLIWFTARENHRFDDMDHIVMADSR